MQNMCQLSIIDEEQDKKNRTCAKYNVWCDGDQEDMKQCPDWSIYTIIPLLKEIVEELESLKYISNSIDCHE